jgi:hypothetical protein
MRIAQLRTCEGRGFRGVSTKPSSPIVARRKGYALYSNGELWTTGPHAYMAGYVMDPGNIDTAIDVAEEEMRIMMADARIEFGL